MGQITSLFPNATTGPKLSLKANFRRGRRRFTSKDSSLGKIIKIQAAWRGYQSRINSVPQVKRSSTDSQDGLGRVYQERHTCVNEFAFEHDYFDWKFTIQTISGSQNGLRNIFLGRKLLQGTKNSTFNKDN